jgi:hypothetical protein
VCGSKKMMVGLAATVFCITLSSPALPETMGQDYYSAQHGLEVAVAKQCGVSQVTINKALQYYLVSVPKETTDIEFQKKIIDAFYEAALRKVENISTEECEKSKRQFLEYEKFFDKLYRS